jgi:hypothetical protein
VLPGHRKVRNGAHPLRDNGFDGGFERPGPPSVVLEGIEDLLFTGIGDPHPLPEKKDVFAGGKLEVPSRVALPPVWSQSTWGRVDSTMDAELQQKELDIQQKSFGHGVEIDSHPLSPLGAENGPLCCKYTPQETLHPAMRRPPDTLGERPLVRRDGEFVKTQQTEKLAEPVISNAEHVLVLHIGPSPHGRHVRSMGFAPPARGPLLQPGEDPASVLYVLCGGCQTHYAGVIFTRGHPPIPKEVAEGLTKGEAPVLREGKVGVSRVRGVVQLPHRERQTHLWRKRRLLWARNFHNIPRG